MNKPKHRARAIDPRLLSRSTQAKSALAVLSKEQRRRADIKAAVMKGEKSGRLLKQYDKVLEQHASRQVAMTKFDYDSLLAMIKMGAESMISYVYSYLTEKRGDTIKLLKAARLFDPIYASRTFGAADSCTQALKMVDHLRVYDPFDNDEFIRRIKSEVPAYIKHAAFEDRRVPTKTTSDPLNFHYLASGKTSNLGTQRFLVSRPFMYEAAKKLVLLQPTSATA